jgi:hypothetical protein
LFVWTTYTIEFLVLFVCFSSALLFISSLVSLPGCTNIVSEYFSLRLAHLLGLASPLARIIDWSCYTEDKDRTLVNEWSALKENLTLFVQQHGSGGSVRDTGSNEADARKVGAELDRGFLLVMSVIIGSDLDRLAPETCAALFADAPNPFVRPEAVVASVMAQINATVASDAFPNLQNDETATTTKSESTAISSLEEMSNNLKNAPPIAQTASSNSSTLPSVRHNQQTKSMTCSAQIARRCRGLGQMVAYDALLNNGDRSARVTRSGFVSICFSSCFGFFFVISTPERLRFRMPALWANSGNFHNVFVETSPERTCVAYIDNQVSMLD